LLILALKKKILTRKKYLTPTYAIRTFGCNYKKQRRCDSMIFFEKFLRDENCSRGGE